MLKRLKKKKKTGRKNRYRGYPLMVRVIIIYYYRRDSTMEHRRRVRWDPKDEIINFHRKPRPTNCRFRGSSLYTSIICHRRPGLRQLLLGRTSKNDFSHLLPLPRINRWPYRRLVRFFDSAVCRLYGKKDVAGRKKKKIQNRFKKKKNK